MILIEYLTSGLAILISIPVLVFLLQVLIGLPKHKNNPLPTTNRPNVAILIPAHNEAEGIAETLSSILSQLIAGDRLIVVADNCSDNTAEIAAGAGAEVIVRCDEQHRGKGFALDFGIRYLEKDKPDIVIFIDADCLIHLGTIDYLAVTCQDSQVPVQALYLMLAPATAGIKMRFAQFAWAIKNRLRAMGYHRVGLSSSLKGSGMAFPWAIISSAQLANSHIVEDMKMGIDFACAGFAAVFCPEALVTSYFPVNQEGVKTQRTRWEHGHIAMIQAELPRIIAAASKRGDIGLLFLALDLAVPPLALLVLSILLIMLLGVAEYVLLGLLMPLLIAGIAFGLLMTAVLMAWWAEGRQLLSVLELIYAPLYVLKKIPLYIGFFIKRQVEWVRSSREQN